MLYQFLSTYKAWAGYMQLALRGKQVWCIGLNPILLEVQETSDGPTGTISQTGISLESPITAAQLQYRAHDNMAKCIL